MEISLLGIGVGFDAKGAGTIKVVAPGSADGTLCGSEQGSEQVQVVVEDSREGWVEALKILLEAYFLGKKQPEFDMSSFRLPETPAQGAGGVGQGSEPLKRLLASVKGILEELIGETLSVVAIVDIINKIGAHVVGENNRRPAEIALGDAADEDYLDLKNYVKNPQREAHGWASNNSVVAKLGMDYTEVCERICRNGEPGIVWLENMQTYGRMGEVKADREAQNIGGCSCMDQTLESFEICGLVETFPAKHESLEDFLETLRFSVMYAKTVTLGATPWAKTNEILARNRRIGCSMSGLAQFLGARGIDVLKQWCEAGYQVVQQTDAEFSARFGIPISIRTTCIKPSGTVSLLAGATPGLHYPESKFYIRRVCFPKTSDVILGPIRDAGYKVQPAVVDPEGTVVVEIPVDAGEAVRTVWEVSMWEQLSFAAFLQRHWADNQLSCTVTFDPETEGSHLARALDHFQYHLKSVSFLPKMDYGAFPQMPYEAISESRYKAMVAELRGVDLCRGQPESTRDDDRREKREREGDKQDGCHDHEDDVNRKVDNRPACRP